MEAKHTPGPWFINEHAEIECEKSILGRVYIGDSFPSGEDEWDANAKIIAAAPDLLSALIEVTENWASSIDHYNGSGTDDKVRAAIKKATLGR